MNSTKWSHPLLQIAGSLAMILRRVGGWLSRSQPKFPATLVQLLPRGPRVSYACGERKSTTSFFFITLFVVNGVAFKTSKFNWRSLAPVAPFHSISKHPNATTVATIAGNVQQWPRLTFWWSNGANVAPRKVQVRASSPYQRWEWGWGTPFSP